MFEDLNRCMGWSIDKHPKNGIVFVTTEDTDSGFVLHHFISLYLKGNFAICLVTLAQTFSHYSQAGSKVGGNLDKAKAEGKLTHIDVMGAISNTLLEIEFKGMSSFQNMEVGKYDLKDLFMHILRSIKAVPSVSGHMPTPSLLVIDDISMLIGLGFSTKNVQDFIHYLNVICKTSNVLLVTSMPTLKNEKSKLLATTIKHIADTLITVQPLSSGYSKEVHGHISITKKINASTEGWQYKLTEKNLKMFAKGTSSAVL